MSEMASGGNGPGSTRTDPAAGPVSARLAADAGIEELAEVCRRYVRRALGVELDFSPETLPVLDHYVTQSRRDVGERSELLSLMARVVGVYFGEVARRHLDLFWRMPQQDACSWELCGRAVFLAIHPVGVAYDALRAASDHEGPSSQLRLASGERELVERRLQSLPGVSEGEYYMLATRLEVIEIAASTLRAEMLQAGSADIEFDARDYEPDPWAR